MDGNGSKNFVGKEMFQRMNYLYQISEYTIGKAQEKGAKTNKKCFEFISNYYSNLVITIGKKTQLRLDPSIKRTICKGCQRLLIPGKTARVRLRKKPKKHSRWTCLHCGSYRVYNTDKNYQLWSDRPEAVVDMETEHQDNKKNEDKKEIKTS